MVSRMAGSSSLTKSHATEQRSAAAAAASFSGSSSSSRKANLPVATVSTAVVHPDLVKERSRCTFSTGEMTLFILGEEVLAASTNLRKLFSNNPSFQAKDLWWMSGSQRYLRACRQAEEFVRIVRHYKLLEKPEYLECLLLMTGEDFFLHVHLAMFVPAIENLADDQQKLNWLPLAKDFRMLGTYAQTELGHGSNVAGLETTAEFDEQTDEWILNTPTMTATKWWAGGLAKSCNFCVLMARLRAKGKDHGVFPFLLQIRDALTHQSLPGIVLNHLGQKLGYNGMDNGTMQLHRVRIPRRNLFMRFCSVSRDGTFVRKGDQKLLYATMTFTRMQIIANAAPQLAKCVTIATRYSAVRRQFPDPATPLTSEDVYKLPEAPVLDYSSQQRDLFPLIATCVAFWSTVGNIKERYNLIMAECGQSDFSRLSDLHAITSGLKAAMTSLSLSGIDACRRMCGGHGYALSAGIPLHLTSYIPQSIYEGDFVVLSLQTGRILLKLVDSKMKGAEVARLSELSMGYLYEFDPFEERTPADHIDWMHVDWHLKAYRQRSCVLTYKAAQDFSVALSEGKNLLQALEEIKIQLTRVTIAYAHVFILDCLRTVIDRGSCSAQLRRVLDTLSTLYALHWMEADFTEFLVSRVMKPEHYDELTQVIKQLLKDVRPNAVGLVDSFSLPDYMLNSVLGRYDGMVYDALMKSTYDEPLNREDVTEGYYKHLQYILHPERKMPAVSRL